METNELLRVGNWVDFGCDEFTELKKKHALESNHFKASIHDIPLTKYWLLKLGFDACNWLLNCDSRLSFDRDTYTGNAFTGSEFVVLFNGDYLPHINSVHRLQNLYFTMTGKELTVKKETVLDRLRGNLNKSSYFVTDATKLIQDIESGKITELK